METFKPEELIDKIDNIESIKKLPENFLQEKTVLGIDIYKYSKFPIIEQVYVPVVFDILYRLTVANIIQFEAFHFNSYGTEIHDFKKHFISTGDGGFQIFNDPIQAIVFSLYFQANLKRYVSGGSPEKSLIKLYKIINNLELRYAITFDYIYSYADNFFGPAIINNSRILSKDSLNRLLVDSNTINWFTANINSVENLLDITKEKFLLTNYFKNYDSSLKSLLFEKNGTIKSVDVLKIGQLDSKATILDIYNLHIQAVLRLNIIKHKYNKYVLTLGNLNTTGII